MGVGQHAHGRGEELAEHSAEPSRSELSALLTRALDLFDRVVGDPASTRASAQDVVRAARDAQDMEALVAGLRAVAESHRRLLDHGKAAPLLEEGVRIARRYRLEARLGEVLMTRGVLRLELGRWDDAQRDLDRAARLLGPARAVEVELAHAAVAHNAGRLTEAAAVYARILRRTDLTNLVRARAANNLGLVEATLGNHAAADAWLAEATEAAGSVGDVAASLVAATRAWATVKAGRLTEGVARFDEAFGLWAQAGSPLGELHAEYADALADLRLIPEARAQADRAATALTDQGIDLVAVEATIRAADLALAAGDAVAAQRQAEETLRRLRRQRRADWRARANLVRVEALLAQDRLEGGDHTRAVRAAGTLARLGIAQSAADAYLVAGRVAAAIGRPRLALEDWGRAAACAPKVPVLARLTGHLARALAAQTRADDAELLRTCRRALTDLDRHRAALPSRELRALASGHGQEIASLGLDVMLRAGSPAQTFAWMERTRAHALSAALSAAEHDSAVDLNADLKALRAVQTELARARRADRSARMALQSRQSEIEARIRRSGWTGEAPTHRRSGAAVSLRELRRALDGRTVVEYDVHDGRIVAVVVDSRRTRLVDVADRTTVEGEIDELRSALHALNVCVPEMAPGLHAAARDIVGDLADLLVRPLSLPGGGVGTGVDGVVVVPVGELQRVPWSAMFDCPVSVAPSATLWMRSAARAEPAGSVVLAAGPGLVGAVPEVQELAARHVDARVFAPPHSTVDAVKVALDGASLAHLACHGEVRTDNPIFSSLRLSDGKLTLHELDLTAAVPHRLVLAACDVGESVAYPGNEVLGFIGTLLSRGTAGVVGSTMLVLDDHVTPMMLALHDGVRKGQTLAEGLHHARARLDPDDPKAYPAWCTFTAYGAG